MSQDRSEKELQDTIGFLAAKSEVEMRKYCSDGVKVANSSLTCLGNPNMGVYLCKHADLLQPSPLMDGQSGFIVMFKIIKGKAKMMVKNNRVGESFEPTPGFDCHLFRNVNFDLASVSLKEAYESTQLYFYEYTEDLDVRERPHQVIPYAVVPFHYVTVGSPRQKSGATDGASLPNELCSIRPNAERLSLPLKRKRTLMPRMDFGGSAPVIGASRTSEGEIVWTGQLCLYSTTVSDVEMMSFSTFVLPWLLDPCLNLDHNQVGHDEIMTYYQLELLSSSPREQECRLCGKYFNYCALQSKSKESRNFLHVVNMLTTSKLGSRITLDEDVDLIIVPHCRITYRLGLSSRFSDLPLLHCIFISASSYDRGAASYCHSLHFANNEIPVGIQLFESGSHHADVGYKMSIQESVVSSRSVKQSSHSAQSRVNSLDEGVLTFTQPTLNSFCPFYDKSDNAQSGQSGAFMLNASASLDNPFSVSKLSHNRKLIQERSLSFDCVPAVFSDLVKPNVVKPNLPVSGSFSSTVIESPANDNQLQLHNVMSKQRDSSQECNERTRDKMEVRENVRDDIDADTEYSPLLYHVSLRLGSSNAKDNEEHRQGMIKSCPSTLVRGSERTKNVHDAKPAEMDKADLSDEIADESIRMKILLSKGGGETIDGMSMIQHCGNDAITISASSTLHEKEILLRMVDLLDEGLQPNQLDRLETLVLVPDDRKKDEIVSRTECTSVMPPPTKPIDVPVDKLNVPKEAPFQPKQNTEIPELDKATTSTNTEMSSSFVRGSYDEKIVTDCVFTVLHRKWVGCFAKRKLERFQSDEDDVQMEIIWTYGLHFLPFYSDSDDDDFRVVNVLDEKGPGHSKPPILKSREDKTSSSSKFQELKLVMGAGNLESRKADGVESRKSSVGAVFNQDLHRDGSRGSSTEQSRSSYWKNRDCKDNSYQSQLRDYRFRDDRFHPYPRRCQLEKKEFFKVYREHRDFAELLQNLTSCNFKSRCNRPVQASFSPVSPATPARFEGCVFRRSTMDDADFILGQREKVDDCLEDIIFDKDQIPDFDAKKVIAEALDNMIRPFSASSSASRSHAPKKSRHSQETAGLCQASDFAKSSLDKSGKSA